MITELKKWIGFHPRAWMHSLLTYPRFLGRIKPGLLAGAEQEILARLRGMGSCWNVSKLAAPIGKRLLVLAPHPDDEAIGAGGLLLSHRGLSEIHLINLFNGEGGGNPASRENSQDIVSIRQKEWTKVADKLGAASVQYLGLRDGQAITDLGPAKKLRQMIDQVKPDVVILPWYLDNQRDHRATNILYAWGSENLDCLVIGFEIWTLCPPNAYFEISSVLEEKIALVQEYESQNQIIDYAAYARALAIARAFLVGGVSDRAGAVEAFFVLPSRDYCDLVQSFYGKPGTLSNAAKGLL